MCLIRLIFIIGILIFFTTASAFNINEYMLGNGLEILIIEEHRVPIATFQIWYRTGSKHDPIGKTGLSHLVEHMMFKGTEKYSTQVFSSIIQVHGGTDNAYTTEDYTVYFQVFPSDNIMLSIELEADRMRNLPIESEDLISEKNVVTEERRLEHDDDPETLLFEEVVALSFKVHPYQHPVIGWMSDIQTTERDDVYDFYKTYYVPNNAFIVIAGNVRTDEVVKKVKDIFGTIPAGHLKKSQIFSEPEQNGERRVLLKREAELPYILAAYHTPGFPDKDSYALAVLDILLTGGKSSRLYQHLVYDKQLALEVGSEYGSFNSDPYLFFIDATIAPGKDVKEVEDALFAEIEKLKRERLSEKEIQKAKNQIEASFILDQDSIEIQAEKYGMFEMLGGWRLAERYLEGIRNVTLEDVMVVIKKYLHENNRTVGILIPTRKQ
jgi:zinc protease